MRALALLAALALTGCTQPATTVEPEALGVVRRVLCQMGYRDLKLDARTIPAKASCPARDIETRKVMDVVLGKDSLATLGVCNAAGPGFCDGVADGPCLQANNRKQFLCRCGGAGTVRNRDGTTTLEGLFRSFSFGGTGTCPPNSHKGCTVRLEMEAAHWHLLRRVSADDDTGYPATLKTIIDEIRADPRRGQRRSQMPACLRGSVPVRAGHADTEPAIDDDGGTLDY